MKRKLRTAGSDNVAYSELIKSFEKVRSYMKEVYIYGLKSREEFSKKSTRTYDNEKRRIEGYLSDHIRFKRDKSGKNVFISIDSKNARHNPFYKVWKAKSFTDSEITLHFILFDILKEKQDGIPISEILELIENDYLSAFEEPMQFDESTVRKKLTEYKKMGLIQAYKNGRTVIYTLEKEYPLDQYDDLLNFFSEIAPCGVIGSYILDKSDFNNSVFCFKHHYLTSALDSEVLCTLFEAISKKMSVTLQYQGRKYDMPAVCDLIPLKIFSSVSGGRQYLFAYNIHACRMRSYRIDFISHVTISNECHSFDTHLKQLNEAEKHIWGVSVNNMDKTEHVEFTIRTGEYEQYAAKRLYREKRCGTVEKTGDNTYTFSADVYDSAELVPWIRTFICRITHIEFSNKAVERQFLNDMKAMYRLYGIGGGEQ